MFLSGVVVDKPVFNVMLCVNISYRTYGE